MRGRPQKYPLNKRQITAITNRLLKGESRAAVAEALGVHPFAVIRVARTMATGA